MTITVLFRSVYFTDGDVLEYDSNVAKLSDLVKLKNYDDIHTIIINNEHIYDSDFIKTFKERGFPVNLTNFKCRNTFITKIPILSHTVQHIDCSYNLINEIIPDELPRDLVSLNCRYNRIKYIPSITLHKFKELNISHNEIKNMFDFITTAYKIDISHNELQRLDIRGLPNHIEYFDCSYNKLYFIENIPDGSKYFNCSNNFIIEIPLRISNNKLTHLICNNNNITNIPVIPYNNSIEHIDISNNPGKYGFDNLKNCSSLDCFKIDNTKIPDKILSKLKKTVYYTKYDVLTYKTYKYTNSFWN